MVRSDSSGGVTGDPARIEQDPRVFARLADAYRREGLLEEAIRICRQGLAAHPDYVQGRAVLAHVLLERGSLDEAEQEFRGVLKQVPEHLLALRFLGDVCATEGRTDEARRYYEKVLCLTPGDAETRDRLDALPTTPKPDDSKGSAQAADWKPDPLASPTLAALYASQGHTDLAAAIYSRLGRRPVEATVSVMSALASGKSAPDVPVLEKLLSLREAARKLREAGRPDPGRNPRHDR